MSKEQVRMMNDDDKLIKEAGNPLTNLFRRVLKEMRVETQSWNRRLTTFLQSHLSRVPKNAKDIGQERNNFNRAIAKRHITFKTFQKAIQILGPLKYSMSITLVMRDGKELTVSTGLINNPYSQIDSLNATMTGKGLNPENDNVDYDEDEEELEADITDEAVDEMIHQIQSPVYRSRSPEQRARLGRVLSTVSAKTTQVKD
jgi:hypothetical protein